MTDVGIGQMQPSDQASDFNAISFMIQQALARTRTMVLVKIIAVHNQGGVEPVGFVDVQPMVSMIDGANVAAEHGTIFNIPYTRLQGGRNAIIIDPEVDDIGWMAVADRDISSVKESHKISAPGSFRRFDLADGVYLGGVLNAAPEQYVRFFGNQIEVVSIDKITWRAPLTEVDGDADVTGNIHGFGNLEIDGNAQIDGSANVSGSGVIDGNLTVGGTAGIGGSIGVEGNISGSGALAATGPFSINGGVQIERIVSGSVVVTGGTFISGALITYTGTVTGARVGDSVAYGPASAIASGAFIGVFNVEISADDTAKVQVWNPFASNIAVPAFTMKIIAFGPA